MTLKELIDLGNIKEKQAFAMTSYLANKVEANKMDVEKLQECVNTYCDNLACNFISQHRESLQDKDLLLDLRKYIVNMGADKPHSGHRFYEALYKKLNEYEKIISNSQEEQML